MSGARPEAVVPSLPARRKTSREQLFALASRLILPWIGVVLIAYIAVHSPLRGLVAAMLRMDTRGCFFCTSMLTIQAVINSISALMLLLTAVTAAWILARRFQGDSGEQALAFGLLVLGLVAIPAALVGETATLFGAGFLRPPAGPLVCALPGIMIVAVALMQGWRPAKPRLAFGRPGALTLLVACLGALLLASSAAISLLHPPSGYDALSYHGPMALFIWQDGNINAYLDRAPAYWALAHPGTSEIWIGLLRVLAGDPLANLGQLPFALLGCAAVYVFARRLGLWRNPALLAAASFLLAPVVVVQSGMQLNDLTGAALLMATIALASSPVQAWKPQRLALMGVGLGLAITTKLVLVPGALAVGVYAVFTIFWRNKPARPAAQTWAMLAALVGGVLLVGAPWWLRNTLVYGNPVFPSALPFLNQGYNFASFAKADLAFVPRRAAWLIYPLLEPHNELSGFGALFAVFALPGIFLAARRARRQPLLLFGWVTIIMLAGWWFLSERFPRFLLAPAGLALAFIPWALLALPRQLRRAGYVLLAAAAIFSALVTFQEALAPLASQPISRAEFFDRVWGVDPAMDALPETEGIYWQFGDATNFPEYTAYTPLLGPSGRRMVVPADPGATTAEIIASMRQHGLTYVVAAASPDAVSQVVAQFPPATFELVSRSAVVRVGNPGTRNSYFRSAAAGEMDQAVIRYIFRLR